MASIAVKKIGSDWSSRF